MTARVALAIAVTTALGLPAVGLADSSVSASSGTSVVATQADGVNTAEVAQFNITQITQDAECNRARVRQTNVTRIIQIGEENRAVVEQLNLAEVAQPEGADNRSDVEQRNRTKVRQVTRAKEVARWMGEVNEARSSTRVEVRTRVNGRGCEVTVVRQRNVTVVVQVG